MVNRGKSGKSFSWRVEREELEQASTSRIAIKHGREHFQSIFSDPYHTSSLPQLLFSVQGLGRMRRWSWTAHKRIIGLLYPDYELGREREHPGEANHQFVMLARSTHVTDVVGSVQLNLEPIRIMELERFLRIAAGELQIALRQLR